MDNILNQPSKFRTKNRVETNDDAHNISNQIKFTMSTLTSSLFDYRDTYILVSGTIAVENTERVANPNNRKNIIIKNCAPFVNCLSELKNTKIGYARDIDVVMPICNSIECIDNHLKSFGSLKMKHFQMIMVLLLIFLLTIITMLRLNLKQK